MGNPDLEETQRNIRVSCLLCFQKFITSESSFNEGEVDCLTDDCRGAIVRV